MGQCTAAHIEDLISVKRDLGRQFTRLTWGDTCSWCFLGEILTYRPCGLHAIGMRKPEGFSLRRGLRRLPALQCPDRIGHDGHPPGGHWSRGHLTARIEEDGCLGFPSPAR